MGAKAGQRIGEAGAEQLDRNMVRAATRPLLPEHRKPDRLRLRAVRLGP